MRMSTALRAAAFGLVFWSAGAVHSQNTNQVMGQIQFEGKSKIDKSSGVWIDGQYLGYVDELKDDKKVLLVPGKHEIAIRQAGYKDLVQDIDVEPGGTTKMAVRMV